MDAYTWPNELDDANRLLGLLGSFWAETYQGSDLVASLLHASAQLNAQSRSNLLELVDSVSRFTLPVFHTDEWFELTLLESKLNSGNIAKYDRTTYTYNDGLVYDVPNATTFFAWPLPANIVRFDTLGTSIANQTTLLSRGSDFYIEDGQVWFSENPFNFDGAEIREVFDGDDLVDRECRLWCYRTKRDIRNTYQQFGYVAGINGRSSVSYQNAINAILDAFVAASPSDPVRRLLASAADAPIAQATETVERVIVTDNAQFVVTPENVYRCHPAATVTVAAGDTVVVGDSVSDAIQFHEFNRGQLDDSLQAIAVGPGLLAVGFSGELVFENKLVPLIVEEDVDGYTKISFEIGGSPTAVEAFWNQVHTNGIAADQTLAMLLDQRPTEAQDGNPTAIALPTTINPLLFLVQNVFRYNLFAVTIRPAYFGPDAVGLNLLTALRRIIPPHQCIVVLVVLSADLDTVTMDDDGNETRAGYLEEFASFAATSTSDDIDPDILIEERVRAGTLSAECEGAST